LQIAVSGTNHNECGAKNYDRTLSFVIIIFFNIYIYMEEVEGRDLVVGDYYYIEFKPFNKIGTYKGRGWFENIRNIDGILAVYDAVCVHMDETSTERNFQGYRVRAVSPDLPGNEEIKRNYKFLFYDINTNEPVRLESMIVNNDYLIKSTPQKKIGRFVKTGRDYYSFDNVKKPDGTAYSEFKGLKFTKFNCHDECIFYKVQKNNIIYSKILNNLSRFDEAQQKRVYESLGHPEFISENKYINMSGGRKTRSRRKRIKRSKKSNRKNNY
jgi:hypothetical protein